MFDISAFDYAISALSILAATVFYFVRKALNAENPPDQWLADVFNVGTLAILLDLMLLPLTRGPRWLPVPWGEAMRGAGGRAKPGP